ncbi:uncharacterized protein LOC129582176 [Paramacrobiotus metropolitanus]|uniref:uncharacterized protein LOC129582176 n=1 Tax=Paramacrobiotus metropolitanus TaxID=2943436 RepID=UPI0024456C70|nr:uncharacterized protein LOC129582176 [Paramacrobiotus metropolitanus]
MAPWSRPWNSVDVLGDDGLFQYGRVVDVADHGLFIDFLCPSRRREFTPFDRVFLNDDLRYRNGSDMGGLHTWADLPAEVLLRDHESGAWTWVPAELLIWTAEMGHADYIVAVVHRGKPQEYADVVPKARIRWKAYGGDRGVQPPVGSQFYCEIAELAKCVKKRTFVKRTMPLPKGCPVELATAALKQQNKGTKCRSWYAAKADCVDVVDGCVVYIQRPSHTGTEADVVHAARELEALKRYHNALMDSVSPIPKPILQIPVVDEAAVLPPELWTEVFLYLDTVSQTKLRPVCPTWHALLDSVSITENLVLDSAALDTDNSREFGRRYFMVAALWKRLSTSTQHLAVADRGQCMSEADVVELLDMASFITQRNSIKLQTVYLFGLECSLGKVSYCDHHTSPCPRHGLCTDNASHILTKSTLKYRYLLCANIRLIKCNFTVECILRLHDQFSQGTQLKLCADICVHRHGITGDSRGALWGALETGILAPSNVELAHLSTWLAALQSHDQRQWRDATMVCKALCGAQVADPRPLLHYHGKRWCVDALQGLELEAVARCAALPYSTDEVVV